MAGEILMAALVYQFAQFGIELRAVGVVHTAVQTHSHLILDVENRQWALGLWGVLQVSVLRNDLSYVISGKERHTLP